MRAAMIFPRMADSPGLRQQLGVFPMSQPEEDMP